MKVNKHWLENKVKSLNEWLQEKKETHFEYKQKLQNRNYYVGKLIELEEQQLTHIKV